MIVEMIVDDLLHAGQYCENRMIGRYESIPSEEDVSGTQDVWPLEEDESGTDIKKAFKKFVDEVWEEAVIRSDDAQLWWDTVFPATWASLVMSVVNYNKNHRCPKCFGEAGPNVGPTCRWLLWDDNKWVLNHVVMEASYPYFKIRE